MTRLIDSLEPRRLFAGFGTDGVASLRFRIASPGETVTVGQLVTDRTGRAYVTATTETTFQVQRLTAAGVLDTTFGKNGSLLFVRTNNAGGAADVQVDASGRLVVLTDDTIVRLNEVGRSDATFARGGVLKLTDFGAVADVSIDKNDKIYVTGAADVGTKNVDTQLRVERFISRGKLDKTFDGDGVYDLPTYNNATGTRKATSAGLFLRSFADGTTIVAGEESLGRTTSKTYSSKTVRAVRFGDTGVDTTYGTNGIATHFKPPNDDLRSYRVSLQGIRAGGQVVFYETGDSGGIDPFGDYRVNRQLDANGVLDFDVGDPTNKVAGGPGSRFVSSFNGRDVIVVGQRSISLLDADGDRDANFLNGREYMPTYTSSTIGGAGVDDSRDGNLLIAGMSREGVRVTVTKVSPTGTKVTS